MAGTVDLLIRGAGVLVTCRPVADGPKRGAHLADPGIVRNGAIAVADGRILAVGPEEEVERSIGKAAVSEVFDAGGRVVMPGWVDPHTHAVFSTYRADEYEARIRGMSYLEIERSGGGIRRTVRGVREMDEGQLFDISRRRLVQMLSFGTTTIEIKSGYGLDLTNEMKMLRVIARLDAELPLDVVATFMGAHQVPPEYGSSADYARVVIDEMIPAVASAGLARFIDVFCEEGVFGITETREILAAGARAGLGLKLHADEVTSTGGAELAAEMHAVSAEHLVMISPAGIERIARGTTIAVLLPCTTFGLGSRRYAPARELVAAGAAVALATDFNPGSSPSSSMQLAVSIACSQMGLTPAEAINAATCNAAFAIGMGATIGSLEPGKKADIVVYDVEDYREVPSRAGMNHAVAVFKGGLLAWEQQGFRERSEVGL